MNIFRPKEFLNKYTDFDIEGHRKSGFDAILIDIDNTIDYPDSENHGTKEAFDFLEKLENAGFKVIIFSNNTKERVLRFLDDKNYDYSYWSFKPLPFAYNKVIRKYKLDKKKIISFGDQILTDCLGANSLGIYTIYVKQLVEKDIIKTKINRKIERFIFKHILHEKV